MTTSDKELAHQVYRWAGIPAHDWPAHFRADCHSGGFKQRARVAYLAILASHRAI